MTTPKYSPTKKYSRINMGTVTAGDNSGELSLPEPSRWRVSQLNKVAGLCIHCSESEFHDPDCIVAIGEDRAMREIARKARGSAAESTQFAAVGVAVMQGSERVAAAKSHNFAKRIARALNNHKPNERGY